MKKTMFLAVLLFCSCLTAHATEKTLFKAGRLKVYVPMTAAKVAYLYDLVNSKPLAGIETAVSSYKKFFVTFGAVTDVDGHGTPYIGIETPLSRKFIEGKVTVGAWGGKDTNANKWRAGVKASLPIFK